MVGVILKNHKNATQANLESDAFSVLFGQNQYLVVIAAVNTSISGVPTGGTNIGTFTEIVIDDNYTGFPLAAWWAPINGIVANQTVTLSHGSAFATMDVILLTGVDGVLDDLHTSLPVAGPASGGDADDPLNGLTTTFENSVVFSAFASVANPTAGSGWTQISGANFLLTQYRTVATPGSVNATQTVGAGSSNRSLAFAVKPSTTRKPIFHDGLIFLNTPSAATLGLNEVCNLIYTGGGGSSGALWDGEPVPGPTTAPNAAVQTNVETYAAAADTSKITILNVEHWPLPPAGTDPANFSDYDTEKGWYEQLLDWWRAENPDAAVAYYAIGLFRDYFRALKGVGHADYTEWQVENDYRQSIVDKMDAIFPSCYSFYDIPEDWAAYVAANIAEARRLAAASDGQPVYCFIKPDAPFPGDDPPSASTDMTPTVHWLIELEQAYNDADGVVPWGGFNLEWGTYGENNGWWQATQEFFDRKKGFPRSLSDQTIHPHPASGKPYRI